MIELWQIVWNIAILGVLFWWVWNGATGRFASVGDIELLKKQQDDHDRKLGQDFLDVFHILEKRISDIGIIQTQKSKKEPGEKYLAAINAGASIAQANFNIGAKTVMDALTRDGRTAPEKPAAIGEPVNIGEEDYEVNIGPKLPDIIIARNQKAAEQIGDRITDDLMRIMDEKV